MTESMADRGGSRAGRRRAGAQIAAALLAAASQFVVTDWGWLSAAGFLAAAVLFGLAGRVGETSPPAFPTAGARIGGVFWVLFGLGTTVCLAAGVAVRQGGGEELTHGLWVAGMLGLAGAAIWSGIGSIRRPTPRVVAALGLLLAVSAGFFCWHLTSMPPEVHGDDAEVGLDAIRLLTEKPFNLFRVGWYVLPMFHSFPTALGLEVAGVNLVGLRGTSAVLGIASVLLIFGIGYRLWGLQVGLLSGLLLAGARFFIHLSRGGFHYVDTPFLSVLVVYLFLLVWQELRVGAAVWCGIALGLGIQTYYASRLVPVLLAITLAIWLIGSERKLLGARLLRFGLIVVSAAAAAAPMIGFFSNDWNAFWARTRGTTIFSADNIRHLSHGYGTSDFKEILLIQFRLALGVFNVGPDSSVQYGYKEGLLDPISAAILPLGLGLLCARPLTWRNQALILWIALPLVAGAALTIDTPFFPRISGLMPFVGMAIAVAMVSLYGGISEALGKRGPLAAGAAVAAVLAGIFAFNIYTYFFDYAPNHRHNSPAVEIAAWVRDHGAGRTTYMVSGPPHFSIHHGSIRFLTHGYATADITDIDAYAGRPGLDPKGCAFVFLRRDQPLVERVAAAFGPLDVEEHRDYRGEVAFFTALPRSENR